MNDVNKWEKPPLSLIRIILMQIFYWGIYLWVLPRIVINILISMNLSLEEMLINTEFFTYLISMIIGIIIMFPLLKKERQLDISKMAHTLIISLSIMLFTNIAFGLIMMALGGPSASVNQSGLDMIVNYDQNKFLIMVVIFAPIFEELVFRGGIFRVLRSKGGFWVAALISSFMFGFMHVLNALLLGELTDLIYLFLYGGLGIVLAWAYEHNKSIYACIILHMFYNFIASSTIIFA